MAGPVTVFGPDFPYAYDDWLGHPAGLGAIPAAHHCAKVAIIGPCDRYGALGPIELPA